MHYVSDRGLVSFRQERNDLFTVVVSGGSSSDGPRRVFAVYYDIEHLTVDPSIGFVEQGDFRTSGEIALVERDENGSVHVHPPDELTLEDFPAGSWV